MADISVTAAQVAILNNTTTIRLVGVAGEAIAAGDVVARKVSDGRLYKCLANDANVGRPCGIALEAAQAGKAFTRLVQGGISLGKTALAAKDPDAKLYTSATAGGGKVADATATGAVVIGQVELLTDGPLSSCTRYAWIDCGLH